MLEKQRKEYVADLWLSFLVQKAYQAIIRGKQKRSYLLYRSMNWILVLQMPKQSERLAFSSRPAEEVPWRMKGSSNKVGCFSWSSPICSLSSLRCMEKEPLSCQLLALQPGRDIKRVKAEASTKGEVVKGSSLFPKKQRCWQEMLTRKKLGPPW